jgi:hypothetical protein
MLSPFPQSREELRATQSVARHRRIYRRACASRYWHQAAPRSVATPDTGPPMPVSTPSIKCRIKASEGISDQYFAKWETSSHSCHLRP